jgi:hypothetical protein
MGEIPQLPTTKQFRDAVKTAFQIHGVKISNTKTRQDTLSGWEISYEVRVHYNYRDRNLARQIRRVEIMFSTPLNVDQRQDLDAAIDDIHIWMTLCGVHPFMKLEVTAYGVSKVKAWCLIS